MERPVNFWRDRRMRCAGCGAEFVVDLEWIDRWEQSAEQCPRCGLTCEHAHGPQVTVGPGDLAPDYGRVAQLFWYHTSTCPDWPSEHFDPADGLTALTRMRMGTDERVAAWAASQRAKALHVGTYEAAIHNMLRRMDNQGDSRSQFLLYRVRLRPDVHVREGWLVDPGNWLGDVVLHEVCPPGVDVTRYLNRHEDPGGLSLALGRDAIASVQEVMVPLPGDRPRDGTGAEFTTGLTTGLDDWASRAIAALENASDAPVPTKDVLGRDRPGPSLRMTVGDELCAAIVTRLPVNLRDPFESAMSFREGDDPRQWASRVAGLIDLVEDPGRVLSALDASEQRQL